MNIVNNGGTKRVESKNTGGKRMRLLRPDQKIKQIAK